MELFASLGLALAAGLLIGLQREQSASAFTDDRAGFVGGARTYPLVSLGAACAVLLSRELGGWVVALPFAALVAWLALSYSTDLRQRGHYGLTSEAALLLTFLLGALAASRTPFESLTQRAFVVASVAVVATFLLSVKPELHALLRKVSEQDVIATVKFLIVAVVVLPLLPNHPVDPWGVLNPRKLGLLVLLIAAVGYAGYIAIHLAGARRGIGITGLVGGLVSSTAVTLSFSGKAKEHPELAPSCALAVVLASSIMFPRMTALVAVVAPGLVPRLLLPLGAMAVVGLSFSAFYYVRSRNAERSAGDVRFANPFELTSALKFSALFAVVLLGAELAQRYLGTRGLYAAGVLAGVTDVDAISISVGQMAKQKSVVESVAVRVVVLAAASNTLAKGVLATAVGGWGFGRKVAVAFAGVLVAGAAGLSLVWS